MDTSQLPYIIEEAPQQTSNSNALILLLLAGGAGYAYYKLKGIGSKDKGDPNYLDPLTPATKNPVTPPPKTWPSVPTKPGKGYGSSFPPTKTTPGKGYGSSLPPTPTKPGKGYGSSLPPTPTKPGKGYGSSIPSTPLKPGKGYGSSFPPTPTKPGKGYGSSLPPTPTKPGKGYGSSIPPTPTKPGKGYGSSLPPKPTKPGKGYGSSFPPTPTTPGKGWGSSIPPTPTEPGKGWGMMPTHPGKGWGLEPISHPKGLSAPFKKTSPVGHKPPKTLEPLPIAPLQPGKGSVIYNLLHVKPFNATTTANYASNLVDQGLDPTNMTASDGGTLSAFVWLSTLQPNQTNYNYLAGSCQQEAVQEIPSYQGGPTPSEQRWNLGFEAAFCDAIPKYMNTPDFWPNPASNAVAYRNWPEIR